MRLLRLSGFVLLTLGLFLLVLYAYLCCQSTSLAAIHQIVMAAKLLNASIGLLKLSIGFVLIGGALTYMAARKEKRCTCMKESKAEE